MLQAPQLFTSVWRSAQDAPQSVFVPGQAVAVVVMVAVEAGVGAVVVALVTPAHEHAEL